MEGGPDFWKTVRERGLGKWLEQDLYEYVDELVKRFISTLHINEVDDRVISQILRQIALGGMPTHPENHFSSVSSCSLKTVFLVDGQQAVCDSLYKGVIGALQDFNYSLEKKWKLLDFAVDILNKSPFELKQSHSAKIRSSVLLGLPPSNNTNYQQNNNRTSKRF